MIRFSLRCQDGGHSFDGWFRSGDDYDLQVGQGLVSCPECGSHSVTKALMAPAVSAGISSDMKARRERVRDLLRNSENVGDRFAETATAMHRGSMDFRPIVGHATRDEVAEMLEEGVPIAPVPALPDGHH